MLPKKVLSAHYVEYGSQPDVWVFNMEATKRSIVRQVFEKFHLGTEGEVVRVAVLGVSDNRYIPIHERVFSLAFNRKIEMVTLDIDTDHLGGVGTAIQHDVTKPFPGVPYDVVFSHALMKFLTPDEQLVVIKNAYDALSVGGVTLHIMHPPELEGTDELREWQHRVDLRAMVEELKQENLSPHVFKIESESSVAWLRDTTVLVLAK